MTTTNKPTSAAHTRKWRIELTQEQLCVMIEALEDWHRFLCGQCGMDHATSYIDSPKAMHRTRELLDHEVKTAMFPELALNQSYCWDGGQPNPYMSEAAAISYLLYRESRHQLTLANPPKHYNCYLSDTLTCDEQGPMIKVELINE